MEILNNLFSGGKPKEKYDTVKDEYLQEVKEAVDIVNNGVEKGTFSEMTERLDKLLSVNISRDKYVFEYNCPITNKWSVVVCILFIALCLYYVPIYIGTIVYSDTFKMSALVGILVSAIVIAINCIVIVEKFCEIHFNKRYNTYVKDLKFKNIELAKKEF